EIVFPRFSALDPGLVAFAAGGHGRRGGTGGEKGRAPREGARRPAGRPSGTGRSGGDADGVADAVDAQEVGGAGGAGGRPGDHDDLVALLDASDLQEGLLDLAEHRVGVVGVGDDEGLDAPDVGEAAADGGHGGEGEQRDRRAVARQAPGGLAGHGEGGEGLGADDGADLGGGARDGASHGLGHAVEGVGGLERGLLGGLDDAAHREDRLDGVLADAGLAGEHDGVGALEDGVGDVGGLGAGGARRGDHRFEHLGGDDDGPGLLAAQFDGALLDHRHLFEGQFDAEVAAGDHDAVEGGDDLGEAFHRLRLLDLADEGDADALLFHDLVADVGVGGGADEGQGDEVDAEAQGPAEVLLVLLGEGGDADGDAGEVEALVVGDHAADGDDGLDAGAVDGGHLEGDAAVVDEDGVAGADVAGEALVGGGDFAAGSGDVLGGDGELVAEGEAYRAVGEAADADLGALEVREDADAASGGLGGGPDPVVDLLVDGVVAVAHVEAGDVDAGFDEGVDLLGARAGGADGADDLRSTGHVHNRT